MAGPGSPLTAERHPLGEVELEVLRGGTGQPVLLLHGPTVYEPTAPFLELLSGRVELFAPSHPGFGGSSRPEGFETMYDLVRLYEQLLESLGPGPVTLIGCSFGGWLAAELALTSAHRLDRLILLDPLGIKIGPPDQRDITHVFNTAPAALARLAWHDPVHQVPEALGLGWQVCLEQMSDQQIVRAARGWDALCLYAWRPHLYNPQLRRWLHRVQVPTLMLWGESDGVASVDYGRAYSALIPNARFEIIPEAGHHPELERPREVARRVLEFMGRVDEG
ncbi:MAG: alpha/beta hydrolase [Chloroflexota bacterium]